MAKIRLTKNELKKQKDNLKRYLRYLPTLELKKKQLLVEIRRIQHEIERLDQENERAEREIRQWVDVFAEEIDLAGYISIKEVVLEDDNIAGIEIPVFKDILFEEPEIDYYNTPLWIDTGIAVVYEQIKRRKAREIAEEQERILQDELRTTIQRIKLFEEVKIPESRENIRIIQIFMGDQMTAAVVRGKIAKSKIEKKKQVSQKEAAL
jgi:V/A-type H+-transporting ATPase subunit D